MKVRIFRNLNKHCMSMIAMEGPFKGKVIAHVDSAYLHECSMVVQEASRQRVIRERCKNVHAFVQGNLQCATGVRLRYPVQGIKVAEPDHDHPVLIRYNPYERGEYYFASTGEPVWAVNCAEVKPTGVWVEEPQKIAA